MKVELIEKAAAIVGDNQLLVNIVSKRVQQLNHGSDPFIPTTPEMGLGDIALTEIITGKITWREMSDEELASAAESASSSVEDDFAALAERSAPSAPASPIEPPMTEVTLEF